MSSSPPKRQYKSKNRIISLRRSRFVSGGISEIVNHFELVQNGAVNAVALHSMANEHKKSNCGIMSEGLKFGCLSLLTINEAIFCKASYGKPRHVVLISVGRKI